MDEVEEADYSMDTEAPVAPANAPGGDPQINPLIHEIRITNQVLYIHPCVNDARMQLLQQLNAWEAIITQQNRIQSTRYQVS